MVVVTRASWAQRRSGRRVLPGAVVLTVMLAGAYGVMWAKRSLDASQQRAQAEWASFNDEAMVKETKRRGDVIVEAIEAFRIEFDRYPRRLDELTPGRLSAIDPPTAGVPRWSYFVNDDATWCSLAFGIEMLGPGSLYPHYRRETGSGDWYGDF